MKTLFGTEAPLERCVGYCYYHKKWVTAKQMGRKGCIQKHCGAFEVREAHPVWEQRRKAKEKRKERKEWLNE